MENKKILKRTIIISGLIILIDQILKLLIIRICANDSISIINNIFSIKKVENIGMAFSLNEGNLKNIVISIFVLILLINYIVKQKKYLNNITLTCLDFIIGGGISNLIDRIFRGAVIDFIAIFNFPIFNIADCFVVIGWLLFTIYIIRVEVKK